MDLHEKLVQAALSGKSTKAIKKALKAQDVTVKKKEIDEALMSAGFSYDEVTEKWSPPVSDETFTADEISALKALVAKKDQPAEAPTQIDEAVASLSSDNRKSKTFYIDQDLAARVKTYAEENHVRLADFVEIALKEALEKYK
ncbi:ribbon-helix-helix domain-containing protein [Kurthia massiliensis]|uniref:ribbon-helix-helix domain-containing protein n=1 Tax=Kurthia massiliensis TaxID=1033739 RepID=UPI0002897DAB|nr:ribbon-helix-helix domain-containing protein [Kurthia massiliensis]